MGLEIAKLVTAVRNSNWNLAWWVLSFGFQLSLDDNYCDMEINWTQQPMETSMKFRSFYLKDADSVWLQVGYVYLKLVYGLNMHKIDRHLVHCPHGLFFRITVSTNPSTVLNRPARPRERQLDHNHLSISSQQSTGLTEDIDGARWSVLAVFGETFTAPLEACYVSGEGYDALLQSWMQETVVCWVSCECIS